MRIVQDSRTNPMLRKLCASVLILLVVLPFTAPFPTFDVSALQTHRGRDHSAMLCPFSGRAGTVAPAGSIVPPLLTKAGRLRIDVSPQFESASIDVAPSPSITQAFHLRRSRQSSLIKLRL
jgi:hypothetical protein